MKSKYLIIGTISAILICICIAVVITLDPLMPIITGYGAKSMCSGVFISKRSADSIKAIDLNFLPISLSSIKVNYEEKSVKSSFLWGSSEAIYREGFGVTLIKDTDKNTLLAEKFPLRERPNCHENSKKECKLDEKKKQKLATIAKDFIEERKYGGTPFSFVVMHDGAIAAEAYKDGITKDTRLLSWSMSKSFMAAMTGIAVQHYGLDIMKPCEFEQWTDSVRSKITINSLLQMESGLEWNEAYGSKSDVNLMLHTYGNMGKYAIEKPAAYLPGENYSYASGSTNIVSLALREHIGCDSLYYDIAYNKLFAKIGAKNAIFEVDAAGTLVGSSYVYARTTDYANFGQLHLNDGIWNNERILPEGWVEYVRTQNLSSDGEYGACFWLNKSLKYKSLPEDLYSCNGYDGQRIFIIPSKEIVITFLGYSPNKRNPIDFEKIVFDVIAAIEH